MPKPTPPGLLERLGLRRGDPDPARESTPPPAAAVSLSAAFDNPAARMKLHELFDRHDRVALGKLHTVNLDDLIVSAGAQRERTLARLREVTIEVLGEHLGPHDAHDVDEAGNVTLYFPQLRRDAAELKAGVIGDALIARARNAASELQGLRMHTTTQEVGRQAFRARYPRQEGWVRSAEDIRQAKARTAAGEAALRSMAEQYERPPDMLDCTTPWGAVLATPPHADAGPVTTLEHPLWRVDRAYITARALRPAEDGPEETRALPASDLSQLSDRRRADIDAYVLATGIARLERDAEAGTPMLRIVPVAFRSVERDPHRLKLLTVLQEVPEAIRKFLVLEITDTPPHTPRLSEAVNRLRRLCRSLILRLPLECTEMKTYANAGIRTVGVDLSDAAVGEAELFRGLDRFAGRVERAGVSCYAVGLPSRAVALAAYGAGFVYVGGRAIDLAAPPADGVARFVLRDLYEPQLPSNDPLARG